MRPSDYNECVCGNKHRLVFVVDGNHGAQIEAVVSGLRLLFKLDAET